MEFTPNIATEGQRSYERIAKLASFISKGGQLIIRGQYPDALNHFIRSSNIKDQGVVEEHTELVSIPKLNPGDVEMYAHKVAVQTRIPDGNNLCISLAPVIIGNPPKDLSELKVGKMSLAEESLAHETALIYMEEWLHILQNLVGRSLEGYEDPELDVAAYMHRRRVPLTKAFLDRYGRSRLGIKAGAKRVDPDLNQQDMHSFADAVTLDDLLKLVRERGTIYGSKGEYEPDKVIELIMNAKRDIKEIDLIPRYDGLRDAVYRLLTRAEGDSFS